MTDGTVNEKVLARIAVLEAKTVFLKNMKAELCSKMGLLKQQTDDKIAALKEATILADKLNDSKHEQMNEVRDQLREQAVTFFTKAEHAAYMQTIELQIQNVTTEIKYVRESVNSINLVLAKIDGKADQKAVQTVQLFAFAGIILSVIGIVTGIFGH